MRITGAQIRAARAFLKWTAADLAKAAGIGISTVQEIEKIDGEPRIESNLQWRSVARDEAIEKINRALTEAGITFLAGNAQGVGIRCMLR
ncbi:helix-turn-helix domain-containing protein [Bradyrhizobium sp. ERR14]|uniref:helix-turn-helix domain-containing protein n=1 Tax=Bradyrhizobium sp. ERR14 TaxID=2663837 RepID=UPI0016143E92|nr:helix-turn-helix domain-containing protein [Bradyrhizobium sp. ERR14]MBB4391784.1 transcriptional regulator with XRE-family HTH domain [Bradyrhizobium sp. ERR14]